MSECTLKQTTKNMYFIYLYNFFYMVQTPAQSYSILQMVFFKNPVANQGKAYLSGATGRF